jgi:acylphosphatase
MNKAVHLRISGVVQGVFFRQHTSEEASKLNIKGWVRNCDDGSVEAEAEGEENNLKSFVEWCHHGPPKAVVTNVEKKDIALKSFSSFEIRR